MLAPLSVVLDKSCCIEDLRCVWCAIGSVCGGEDGRKRGRGREEGTEREGGQRKERGEM